MKSVCHWNYYTIAIKIYYKSMQCLWLRLLWHYRSYIKTNTLVVASPRLLTVLHLTFDLCIGFDLLHSRKCSPLTHLCASKRRVHFHCKIFQLGKPIYVDYFLEALYGLTPGFSKLFCQRTITEQFEDRTSFVIGLFQDMLHSTKSIDFL